MATKVISQELVPSMVAMDSSLAQIGQYVVPQTEGPFNLTSVFVYVTKTGTPDPALISLYVYDEYGPGGEAGSLLASATAISTSDMTTPGWVEYVLDTPVAMSNGTGYWILVLAAFWSVEESPASNYWSLGCSTANPYTAGVAVTIDLFGTYAYPTGYDLGFQLWAGESLALVATAPLHEATGVMIAPTSLTWEGTGFDPATMGYDVYFRMFGVTQFTLVGDGQAVATLVLPDNLVYNFLYFWKVNIRNLATDEILLAGGEWYFNTEALVEYPTPSTRTVPDGLTPPGTMTVITGDNCVAAIRRIVAACNNEIWYEAIE
jgi:hypothetical protein